MLKIGKLCDYGTLLMSVLAEAPDRLLSAHDLADRTRIGRATVSKLLKRLVHAGLIQSIRGARGGYRLARPPGDITVADVISALEGPIALTQCSSHRGACGIEAHCTVRGNWRLISTAIRSALESVTLAEMVLPMNPRVIEQPLRLVPVAGK